MQTTEFRGYLEGRDLSKIPAEYLAYPSRNVMVTKGKVVTRGGFVNDGVAHTVDEAIHSEFVWKDAPGGVRALRVHGTTLQVKHGSTWITLFTGLDANTARVFFATWVDSNTSVIKKRLFFCDGSTNLYQWNGFIGTVQSYDGGTHTITCVADKANLGLMGADAGNVTNQNVSIFSLDANGNVDGSDTTLHYSTDVTSGLTIPLSGAPSVTPIAGDLVMSQPVTFSNVISANYNIDVIINYNNHIVAAQYDDVNIYFSDVSVYVLATGLDFVQPVAASRTALTPIYLQLEGGFQGMITRKGVLWISDNDDWYKVTKTETVNAYGLWVDTEKFETGENKGCLPMAVAKRKGDIIYFARDLTLQRITTLDVIGKDDIELLSDGVESLLQRLDNTDVRLYYLGRAIYIIFPAESTLVLLDTAEQEWYFQPPQDTPMNCMSVIDGVTYGHHNAHNETFELFSGRNDLGANMAQAVIALGYQHGKNHYAYKKHNIFGVDCRMTRTTDVLVERFIEENGSKATESCTIEGASVTAFQPDDDVSWATHPYGSRSWGGADMVSADLLRVLAFDRGRNDGYFETRPVLTISGTETEFHLLGLYWEESTSPRVIGSNLFISR